MAELRITQVRSTIGAQWRQRESLRTLGLRRIRHSVVREDSPQVRGLIAVVNHLVVVEPVTAAGPEQKTTSGGPEQKTTSGGPEQRTTSGGPEQKTTSGGPEQRTTSGGPEQKTSEQKTKGGKK